MRSEQNRRSLIEEFPEIIGPEIILQKEVYAHFGLTFYHFALVEHSLINIVIFSFAGDRLLQRITRTREDWASSIDEGERLAVRLTFGNLVKTTLKLPEFQHLEPKISKAKKLRDYFAHHFMREEAALMNSDDGCWFALEKMQQVRHEVSQLEIELQPCFQAMLARYGVSQPTKEELDALTKEYLSERECSLHDGSAAMGWEKA